MKIWIVLLFVSAFVFSGCSVLPSTSRKADAPQNLSPTETMRALNEAAKAKDTAKTKILISKGTLDLLEKSAKTQDTTIDDLLQEDGGAPFQDLPEMRNETIAGETATVEIKNTATGEWQPLPFVKEDGIWKVALDKVVEDVLEKARKDMRATGDAPAAGNANRSKMPVNQAANNKSK